LFLISCDRRLRERAKPIVRWNLAFLAGDGYPYAATMRANDSSRFVAALHTPGVQLLVMSARYQVPVLLRELIAKRDYRQVYLDLNSAGERSGRFFAEDLGADGLRADRERDRPFDITWRDAVQRTLYNSNWKEQQLSENEYRARLTKDATEYGKVLRVLLGAFAAESSEARE
jgi:hypothetical protein